MALDLTKVKDGPRQKRKPARPPVRLIDAGALSRAQGCLLGQLAGDALGSAVEFRTAAQIARSHPSGVTELVDGGTWNLIAGQPTDDSEMALALARELVGRGRFDEGGVADAYVKWRRSEPFDIGNTTAEGIEALAAGRRQSSDSQSNGALMRVSPIGMFAAGKPAKAAELATQDAGLTHPHPICRAANAAYAAAIAAGIQGATPDAMWSAAHNHAGDWKGSDLVRERLVAARTRAPDDFENQIGWVLTAFQNAFPGSCPARRSRERWSQPCRKAATLTPTLQSAARCWAQRKAGTRCRCNGGMRCSVVGPCTRRTSIARVPRPIGRTTRLNWLKRLSRPVRRERQPERSVGTLVPRRIK